MPRPKRKATKPRRYHQASTDTDHSGPEDSGAEDSGAEDSGPDDSASRTGQAEADTAETELSQVDLLRARVDALSQSLVEVSVLLQQKSSQLGAPA